MLRKFGQWATRLSALFFPMEDQAQIEQQDDHYLIVEQAKREWQDAKTRFEQASDPDLIDSAIYAIEAAEKRYVYLLKRARKEIYGRSCALLPNNNYREE